MTAQSDRYNAQQTARMLLELFRIAALVRLHDTCVGELRPSDILVSGSRISRRPDGYSRRIRSRYVRNRHLKRGHDHFCQILGIPERTLRGMLESWGGPEIASFLSEIVGHGVEQFTRGGWHGMTAYEVLTHEIGRCLTLETPADSL